MENCEFPDHRNNQAVKVRYEKKFNTKVLLKLHQQFRVNFNFVYHTIKSKWDYLYHINRRSLLSDVLLRFFDIVAKRFSIHC